MLLLLNGVAKTTADDAKIADEIKAILKYIVKCLIEV